MIDCNQHKYYQNGLAKKISEFKCLFMQELLKFGYSFLIVDETEHFYADLCLGQNQTEPSQAS